jgi:hypothetical protein
MAEPFAPLVAWDPVYLLKPGQGPPNEGVGLGRLCKQIKQRSN